MPGALTGFLGRPEDYGFLYVWRKLQHNFQVASAELKTEDFSKIFRMRRLRMNTSKNVKIKCKDWILMREDLKVNSGWLTPPHASAICHLHFSHVDQHKLPLA